MNDENKKGSKEANYLELFLAPKGILAEAIQATAPQHSTRDWEIQALDYGL